MKTTLRLGLTALTLGTATMAEAATFTRIELYTTGVGTRSNGITSDRYVDAIFTYVVPPASAPATSSPAPNVFSFAATPELLFPTFATLTATTSAFGINQAQGDFGLRAVACYTAPTSGALPTVSFVTDPSCSPITLNSLLARSSRTYSGRVTEVRISQFEADNIEVGLVSITSAVPEPSTWALMLAGFGLTGYVLRRRYRSRVALA